MIRLTNAVTHQIVYVDYSKIVYIEEHVQGCILSFAAGYWLVVTLTMAELIPLITEPAQLIEDIEYA